MDRKQIALEVIAEVSGAAGSTLTPETELIGQLGIDSPRVLQMLVQLEDRLDVEISDEDVENLNTVGDILNTVEAHFAQQAG